MGAKVVDFIDFNLYPRNPCHASWVVEQNGIGGHWIKIFLSAPPYNSLSMDYNSFVGQFTNFGTSQKSKLHFHFVPEPTRRSIES